MPDIGKIIATPISLISKLGSVQKSAMTGIFRSQYTIPSSTKVVTYEDSRLKVDGSTSTFNATEGTQLIFDLSDSSLSGHPFTLATANDESTNYANVTSSGTPGNTGATLTTTLPAYASNQTLWWYCSNSFHSGEGASFAITEVPVGGWDGNDGVILLTPNTAIHSTGHGSIFDLITNGSTNTSPSAAQQLAAINQPSGSSDGDTSYIRYPNSNSSGWYFAAPIIYRITAGSRLDGGNTVPYSPSSGWVKASNAYSNNGDGSTAWTKADLDDIYIGVESKYADIWFSFDREAHTNTEDDVPDSATITKIEVKAEIKGSNYQSYKGVKQHGYVTQVYGLVYYS
jgi:hypothetical protein